MNSGEGLNSGTSRCSGPSRALGGAGKDRFFGDAEHGDPPAPQISDRQAARRRVVDQPLRRRAGAFLTGQHIARLRGGALADDKPAIQRYQCDRRFAARRRSTRFSTGWRTRRRRKRQCRPPLIWRTASTNSICGTCILGGRCPTPNGCRRGRRPTPRPAAARLPRTGGASSPRPCRGRLSAAFRTPAPRSGGCARG